MEYSLSSRIRKFREDRKLTQKELGELIGVSGARLGNWEHGAHRPDIELLAKLCEALNVSPSEMLDIQLPEDNLNDTERKVVAQYRKRADMQRAVNILLGIERANEDA
jgi:transcriptional regulator with XRE-family HTH domain